MKSGTIQFLLAVILLASAEAAAPPKKSAPAPTSEESQPAQRSASATAAAVPAAGSKAAANAGSKGAGNAATAGKAADSSRTTGNKAASSAAAGKTSESSRGASGNKAASTGAAAAATEKGSDGSRGAGAGNKGAGGAAAATASGKSSDRAAGAGNKGAGSAQQSSRAASTKAVSAAKSAEVATSTDGTEAHRAANAIAQSSESISETVSNAGTSAALRAAPSKESTPEPVEMRYGFNIPNTAPDYSYLGNTDYNAADDDDIISNRMFFLEDPSDRGPPVPSRRSSGATSNSGSSSASSTSTAVSSAESNRGATTGESNRAAPADPSSGSPSVSVVSSTIDAARSVTNSNAFPMNYADYSTGGGVLVTDPNESLDYLIESLLPGDKVVRARAEAVAKFPGQRQVKAHAYAVADKPDQTADAVAIARGSVEGSAIRFTDTSSASGGGYGDARLNFGVRKIAKKIVKQLNRGEKRGNPLQMLINFLKSKRPKYTEEYPDGPEYDEYYDEGDVGGYKYQYSKPRPLVRGKLGKIPQGQAPWGSLEDFEQDDVPFRIEDQFFPPSKPSRLQYLQGYVHNKNVIPHITYQLKDRDQLFRPQSPPEIITSYDDIFEDPLTDPGRNKYTIHYNPPPNMPNPQQTQMLPAMYPSQMYNNQPMSYNQIPPQDNIYGYDGPPPPPLVPLAKPPTNDPFISANIFDDMSLTPLNPNPEPSQKKPQKFSQKDPSFDNPNFDTGTFYQPNIPQYYGSPSAPLDAKYDEGHDNFDMSSSPFYSGQPPLQQKQVVNSQSGQMPMSNPRPSMNYWQSSPPFTNFLDTFPKNQH